MLRRPPGYPISDAADRSAGNGTFQPFTAARCNDVRWVFLGDGVHGPRMGGDRCAAQLLRSPRPDQAMADSMPCQCHAMPRPPRQDRPTGPQRSGMEGRERARDECEGEREICCECVTWLGICSGWSACRHRNGTAPHPTSRTHACSISMLVGARDWLGCCRCRCVAVALPVALACLLACLLVCVCVCWSVERQDKIHIGPRGVKIASARLHRI